MVAGYEEHHVERLVSHRFQGRNKKLQFLVSWTGYGEEENSWEFEADLTADGTIPNDAIAEYWARLATVAGTQVVPTPTKKPLKNKKFTGKSKLLPKGGQKRQRTEPGQPGGRRKYPRRQK
jgi:Chromo (CHRromatin Organisation MOdifier) domain